MDRIILIIILFPILLFSLIIHEIAHGRMAFFRGDPTALYQNRLSLNPLVHLDPVGTLLLISTLFFSIVTRVNPLLCLGWAKPAPVKEENLENPGLDVALVALAGPTTNFIMAFIAGLPFQIGLFKVPTGELASSGLIAMFLYVFININILLAIFNLIPLPPLDGSRVLMQFLPESYQAHIKTPGRPVLIMTMILTFFLINWSGFNELIKFLIKIFTNIMG